MPAIAPAAHTEALDTLKWESLASSTDAHKALHAHLAKFKDDASVDDLTLDQLRESAKHIGKNLPSTYNDQVGSALTKGAEKADGPAGGDGNKQKIWPWAVASGTIGAATTALIVWAIMHNHDKKLMTKLAAASSQSNSY